MFKIKFEMDKSKTEKEHYLVNKTLLCLCFDIAKLGIAFRWNLKINSFKMWTLLLRDLNLDYRAAMEKYLPLESDVEKVELILAECTLPTGWKKMFSLG